MTVKAQGRRACEDVAISRPARGTLTDPPKRLELSSADQVLAVPFAIPIRDVSCDRTCMSGAVDIFEREVIRVRTVAGLTAAWARRRVGGRPTKLSARLGAAQATAVTTPRTAMGPDPWWWTRAGCCRSRPATPISRGVRPEPRTDIIHSSLSDRVQRSDGSSDGVDGFGVEAVWRVAQNGLTNQPDICPTSDDQESRKGAKLHSEDISMSVTNHPGRLASSLSTHSSMGTGL